MKETFLSFVSVVSLLACQCLGFGTGSHYDLTRTVLTEHDFEDTPIKIVQVENWLTDYYSYSPTHGDDARRVLEKLHFDNLFDPQQVEAYWATLLANLKTSTQKAARDEDELAMLATLGLGMHAVQDFYAHSNWVELHPRGAGGKYRTETFWRAANLEKVSKLEELHTGKYPDDLEKGLDGEKVSKDAATHGGHDKGLNKDSPMRPLWDEAYVFAYAASHELVAAMEAWAEEGRPGFWDALRNYRVAPKDEEKLEKDIAAARNMSMWVKGKGQDGTWKGEGSGSQRFLALFSSKWVTAGSSDFVDIIHDGKVQKELVRELYQKKTKAEMPLVEPYSLRRTAILLRVTYVAERKDGTSILRRMSGIESDFYSRIVAGKQEFWGRTIQKSRETVDPWFEIFIVDPTIEALPLSLAVWDEDGIDSEKDEHIDINPAPAVRDLSFIFHFAGDSLSGDVVGIFNSPGKMFFAEGMKPDNHRAAIRGYVFQREIE